MLDTDDRRPHIETARARIADAIAALDLALEGATNEETRWDEADDDLTAASTLLRDATEDLDNALARDIA